MNKDDRSKYALELAKIIEDQQEKSNALHLRIASKGGGKHVGR
ncbi:MAG TPA: hypothetical protein VEQ38_13000 [Verrucomicrobiae bacterium]|nr:hypothetical protein [Verrucomicrobiae bacterium]